MNQGPLPDRVKARTDPTAPGANAGASARAWRFLLLAQVTDFPALRRALGLAGAERFSDEMTRRALAIGTVDRVVSTGHGTIEIAAEGDRREDIAPLLAALTHGFAQPFTSDRPDHHIEVAIGAAAARGCCSDDLALIEQAEAALGDSRQGGRVRCRVAAASAEPETEASLARELPAAITLDQMALHYQPKVHLRRQEVTSIEALIRWRHPERGLIMPGSFIALAEDLRLIDRLTLWVIRRVIADQAILRHSGYDPRIFINVSGQLLSDAPFVAAAIALVRDSRVNIGFEVTETSVIRDPASAIANLKTFADAGITIAIDDYGAGLSSLAYLKQLPARELKIDKMFVTHLASSHRDPLIVRSTIDLAHALEMEVVAEGVESAAALALLTVMGCDMAQGYLISRPLELVALIRFLDEERYRGLVQKDGFALGRLVGGARRSAK